MGYREFAGDIPPFAEQKLQDLGKELVREIWTNLKSLSRSLYLDTLELLTTLNLALISKQSSRVWLILIGDGFIVSDKEIIEVEQSNRPD